MSNNTDTAEVKRNRLEAAEFYLLKTVTSLSSPYAVNCLEAIDFIDALIAAGWTTDYLTEKTVILTAPSECNVVLFMGRGGLTA
jgi:hypothetical protein